VIGAWRRGQLLKYIGTGGFGIETEIRRTQHENAVGGLS
jgi:hypothetical protein